jgi:hypothetical protein
MPQHPSHRQVALALLLLPSMIHAQADCRGLVDTAVAQPAAPIGFVRAAFRADGRPLLALTTQVDNASELHVSDCADPACAGGTSRLIDQSTSYFGTPGLVVRGNGRPALSAPWLGGLNFYDCGDAGCTFRQVRPIVPSANGLTGSTPMTLVGAGVPAIVYVASPFSGERQDVLAHVCLDAGCSSGQTRTVSDVPTGMSRIYIDLMVARRDGGDLHASWIQYPSSTAKTAWELLHCPGAICGPASPTLVSGPTATSIPLRIEMVVRPDGRPLLLDGQAGRRVLIDCADAACSTLQAHPLPVGTGGQVGGLALTGAGRPGFFQFESGVLTFRVCADVTCASASSAAINLPTNGLATWDLVRGPDDRLLLAYVTADTRQARVATCIGPPLFSDDFEPVAATR